MRLASGVGRNKRRALRHSCLAESPAYCTLTIGLRSPPRNLSPRKRGAGGSRGHRLRLLGSRWSSPPRKRGRERTERVFIACMAQCASLIAPYARGASLDATPGKINGQPRSEFDDEALDQSLIEPLRPDRG